MVSFSYRSEAFLMNCCNLNLISQGNDPDFCLACHTSQHYPSKKGFWVWRLATLLKHFFMFFHYRINNLSSKKQAYSKAYPSISKHYSSIAAIWIDFYNLIFLAISNGQTVHSSSSSLSVKIYIKNALPRHP